MLAHFLHFQIPTINSTNMEILRTYEVGTTQAPLPLQWYNTLTYYVAQ
jgi:hypothetical protein